MENITEPKNPQQKESKITEEEFNEIASNEGQGDTDDSDHEKDSKQSAEANHREIETNPIIFSTEADTNISENTQNNTKNNNGIIESDSKINPEEITNLGSQLLNNEQPDDQNIDQNQPETDLESTQNSNQINGRQQNQSEINQTEQGTSDNHSIEAKNENSDKEIDQSNEISHQEHSIESKDQISIENNQTEDKIEIGFPNATLQDTTNILISTLTNDNQTANEETNQQQNENEENQQQNENEETNQQQNDLQKDNDDTNLNQELNENETTQNDVNKTETNDSNKIELNDQIESKDLNEQIEENQKDEDQSTNNANQIENTISEIQNVIGTPNDINDEVNTKQTNEVNLTNENELNQIDANKSEETTNNSTNINQAENTVNQNENSNEVNQNEINQIDANQNENSNEVNQNEINQIDENQNENSNEVNQNEINSNEVNDVEQKVLGDDSTFFTSNKQFMNETNPIHEPQSKPQQRPRKKVKLTQEEYHKLRIEKLKEYAMQLYPLDDPSFETTNEEFEELIQILINDREKQVSNGNFIESNRINQAVVNANTCYENKQKKELQQQEYNKYLESVKKYEQQLEQFDKETYEMINQLDERNEESLKEIRKRHDDEIDEHYIKWMSDSKLRQYNRASQTLITNRKTLELLLNQNRYVEAHNMQNTIYNLEKKEEQTAMKQRQHDYDESLKMLTDKQKNEEDFLIQKCEIRRDQLIKRRQVERTMFLNKEKKIEAMKKEAEDPEKVWNSMQAQRINEIYKKKPGNKSRDLTKKRKMNQGVVLPPMNENDNIPRTARQAPTMTVLKLPPLKIKKPIRKSNTFVHSSR